MDLYVIISTLINVDIIAAWQMAAICRASIVLLPQIFKVMCKRDILKIAHRNAYWQARHDYLKWATYYAYPIKQSVVNYYFISTDVYSQDDIDIIFTSRHFTTNIYLWILNTLNKLHFDRFNAIVRYINNRNLANNINGWPKKQINIYDVFASNGIFNDSELAIDLIYVPLTDGIVSSRRIFNDKFVIEERYCNLTIDMLDKRYTVREYLDFTRYVKTSWSKYFNIYRSGYLYMWNVDATKLIKYGIDFCQRRSYNLRECLAGMILAAFRHGHSDYIMAINKMRPLIMNKLRY